MKNAFYFILKTPFVLEIFTFLYWRFGYVEKQLDKKAKFEVLCYLQNEKTWVVENFLQKTTTCIGLQAEQIFSIKIWYTYFSNFGHGFCVPFPYYSQNLQPLVVKKIWNSLCCIVLLFVWAQKLCLRFLKSYFKLEVLIFLSFVVPFLVDMFN